MPSPGKTKVTLLGKLRYTEAEGLQFSVSVRGETVWAEALPNAYNWPGITWPDIPKGKIGGWWSERREGYLQLLHADPSYQLAAKDFLERQRREPQQLPDLAQTLEYARQGPRMMLY